MYYFFTFAFCTQKKNLREERLQLAEAENELAAYRQGVEHAVSNIRRESLAGSGAARSLGDGSSDIDDSALKSLTGLGIEALLEELRAALTQLQQVIFWTII